MENNVLEMVKMYPDVKCVAARLRKCNGFIFEAVTVQPKRKNIFELMDVLNKAGYNIYSLRHKENDMSEPNYVTSRHILVNRFGWFVTKDTMKFKKNIEIKLTAINSRYYGLNIRSNELDEFYHYGSCEELSLVDYFKYQNLILKKGSF